MPPGIRLGREGPASAPRRIRPPRPCDRPRRGRARRRDPRPEPQRDDQRHRLGEGADRLRLHHLGRLRDEPGETRRRTRCHSSTAGPTRCTCSSSPTARRQGEISEAPVSTETLTNDAGRVTGYKLTRSFEVRSSRVARDLGARRGEPEASSPRGVPLQAQPPQYVYTKLADLRPKLLADATKDALVRAKVLVDATGGQLGGLRDVNVGVFQITAPNSTDVSDYGVYDTSTLHKDVTAVVNVSFALK